MVFTGDLPSEPCASPHETAVGPISHRGRHIDDRSERRSVRDACSMSFGSESTTDQVLEGVGLSGRWVLITGASAGLGQETARAVVAHGANVVLGVRDVDKGERSVEPVRSAAAKSGATVELREVDLASLASIRVFTEGVAA